MGVEIGIRVVCFFFLFLTGPRVSLDVILKKKKKAIVPEYSQRNKGLKSSIKADLVSEIFLARFS